MTELTEVAREALATIEFLGTIGIFGWTLSRIFTIQIINKGTKHG